MKIGVISDTHGFLPPPPPDIDAIIHCGDIGPDGHYDLRTKRRVSPLRWFATEFSQWAEEFRKPIYATWGNHDQVGQEFPNPKFWKAFLPENVHILVDEAVTIGTDGLFGSKKKVWFSPWSPTFGDWAWMVPEEELAKKFARIPNGVSVIVSHTPPYGYGDYLENGDHVGSKALLAELEDRFSYHTNVFCGHIHNARGHSSIGNGRTRITWVRNCAALDEEYKPVPNPWTIMDWNKMWPSAKSAESDEKAS